MRDKRREKQWAALGMQGGQDAEDKTSSRNGQEDKSGPSPGFQLGRRDDMDFVVVGCKVSQPYGPAAPPRLQGVSQHKSREGDGRRNPSNDADALAKDGQFRYLRGHEQKVQVSRDSAWVVV